jgi:hypothetical protein
VIRSALRRLAILIAVIVGVTCVLSLTIGALAHANLLRALAVGFYVAGAAVLVGSFVFGLRGPLKSEWGDDEQTETGLPARRSGGLFPSVVRRTTTDERIDARKSSIALFGLGILLILIGAGFDPSRHAF